MIERFDLNPLPQIVVGQLSTRSRDTLRVYKEQRIPIKYAHQSTSNTILFSLSIQILQEYHKARI